MMRVLMMAAVLFCGFAGGPATAAETCTGRNLLDGIAPDAMAAMRARVDRTPHARGLFWQAVRGDARIVLIGTFHFGDPRHDATVTRFRDTIADAAALLVEAGPDEEAALTAALRADPTLMADPAGPTLRQRLGEAEWHQLATAMEARGIPAAVTLRLRPWYVATMLGLSPCMLRQTAAAGDTGGLDHRLIAAARAAGTPIRALEPWDTLFSVFDGMSRSEQLDMLRQALPQAAHADDYAATLIEAYFAGDVWMLWEFGRFDAYGNSGMTKPEVDALMLLTKRQLMDRRNRAWLGPLTKAAEDAAGQGRPVVAAFGALHLPGEQGVLSLLEDQGWAVTRLDVKETSR